MLTPNAGLQWVLVPPQLCKHPEIQECDDPSKECVKNAKQSTMEVGRAPKVCCVILSDQVLQILVRNSNVQFFRLEEKCFFLICGSKETSVEPLRFVFDIPPFCPCLLTLPFQTTAATSTGLPFLHISSSKTALGLGSGANNQKRRQRPEIVTISHLKKRGWRLSRLWFQIFFISIPIWGRFPFWPIFFNWVETTN